jgi:ribosomal protein S18 acetylase RimI-like enzyme
LIHIQPLAHRDGPIADGMHALLALAHEQEARVLQLAGPRPPARSSAEIQRSEDYYLGALRGEQIVGILGIGRDDEPGQLCISVLVVHPALQRQGLGRTLVQQALARGPGMAFAVATTAGNAPALSLYHQLGFVVWRHGVIGPDSLPLVKLRRAA